MILLDQSFSSPEKNLAVDDAFLLAAEAGELTDEILRFWAPSSYFVVLGAGRKEAEDVHKAACVQDNIPVFRRLSGGGTVLQGPGVLNYALILDSQNRPDIQNIQKTNQFVMQRIRDGLSQATGLKIEVQGITDLTVGEKKCAGSAQKRLKRWILFQGAILLDLDLSRVEQYLTLPPLRPDYRENRSHLAFMQNLNADARKIKVELSWQWGTVHKKMDVPEHQVNHLLSTRYPFSIRSSSDTL